MFKKFITTSVILLATSSTTMADSFTINGDTTGLATWQRLSGSPSSPFLSGIGGTGSNVPFQTIEVTITDPTAFVAHVTTAAFDTYMHLYSNSFNPLDQFTNLVALDDDDGGGGRSRIDNILDGPFPEGQYVVVVTGYYDSSFGTFALFLDGVLLGIGPSTEQQVNELKASLLQAGQQTVRVLNGNVQAAIAESIASRDLTISSKNTASSALAGNVYVWSKASLAYAENNGHSVRSPILQFGADVAVGSNKILGISLGYGDISQSSGTTVIDGSQVTLQPYFGWQKGSWQGTASVTYGQMDYDTITSASGAASAEGDLLAFSADASKGILLKNGKTLSPFASFSVGSIDLTETAGSLAGAGLSNSVSFQDARFGTRISQKIGSSSMMTFGVSADYYHSNAPVNLISGQFNNKGWSGTAEYGYQVEFNNGVHLNTQVAAGGLGSSNKHYIGSIEIGMQF